MLCWSRNLRVPLVYPRLRVWASSQDSPCSADAQAACRRIPRGHSSPALCWCLQRALRSFVSGSLFQGGQIQAVAFRGGIGAGCRGHVLGVTPCVWRRSRLCRPQLRAPRAPLVAWNEADAPANSRAVPAVLCTSQESAIEMLGTRSPSDVRVLWIWGNWRTLYQLGTPHPQS